MLKSAAEIKRTLSTYNKIKHHKSIQKNKKKEIGKR